MADHDTEFVVIGDRFSASPAAPTPRRPYAGPAASQASASEAVALSAMAQLPGCPTGLQVSPAHQGLVKQARALGETAALQAGGGPTQASTSQLVAQFRQGLCPYLAQATEKNPAQWSALDLLRQGLESEKLDAVDFLREVHEEYGPSVQVGDVLFESRPQVAQEIMSLTDHRKPEKDFFGKSTLQKQALGDVYGQDSLFLAGDESWKERRELLQPFFFGDRVLTETKHQQLQNLTDKHFDRLADQIREQPEVNLNLKLRALALDVALQHIFSVELGAEELESMAQVFDRAGYATHDRLLGRADTNQLDDQLNAVADRLLAGRQAGDSRPDALQAILDSSLGKDPQRLRAEVLTLAMLGHETTGNLLTSAVHELSQEPNRIQAMREEYAQEIGKAEPSLGQTQDLQINRAVIKEATRLHAPNYLVSREAKQDIQLETPQGPLHIAAGTQVLMATQELNRDPGYWDNPAQWNPDRDGSRVYSFGGGARVCLGQVLARLELNVVLSQFVERFEFKASAPYAADSHFSTRPQGGEFQLSERLTAGAEAAPSR